MSNSDGGGGGGHGNEHKVMATTDGPIDYSAFTPTPDLPVIDEGAALEQCCDWEFVSELLVDVINERTERIDDLTAALETNDHGRFHRAAHALKGAALNLYLTALVDVCKKSELLGKQLEVGGAYAVDGRLLAARAPLIRHLETEYARLEAYIPTAQQHAADERGDDADADGDADTAEFGEYDDNGNGSGYRDDEQ